ncbi:C45 family autoproteolytic acyltransferase/hydolase [Radiobacillus deserti]|uniref:Acyl-CoA--6-aminopenicillanic acid acyltransferase n=1 Tax=Radiobacillus deserti TaxID=2594883 RepID=A0A516KKH6_9BACI|nr:C45 family peptidase [Radiobacillus deserti]QDP41886.1 acyl-CoA--6-aminopenicillanic acid acyltransferase [Radiobacillus deserti]
MNKEIVVPVVKLIGSYEEMGYAQANPSQWGLFAGQFDWYQRNAPPCDASEVKRQLMKHAPFLLQEITELANALEISMNLALQIFSGYNVSFPEMGCTAFMQNSIYGRNYDFSPDIYDGRLVIAKPEKGFASIGFSQHLTGRLDGMNEKGLVVGLHYVNNTPKGDGFSATAIVRMVLEQCADLEQAVQFLKHVPHRFCYNFSILDQHGHASVVEATPSGISVRAGNNLACTNHFLSKELKGSNRKNTERSQKRLDVLNKVNDLDSGEVYTLLNHHDSPLFFREYDRYFGTLHTVVYNPKELTALVGIGEDAIPTAIDILDKDVPALIGKLIYE